MAKEINLDDLATLIKQRLDEIDDKIDTNHTEVTTQLNGMERDLSSVRTTVVDESYKIDRIERKLDATIRTTDRHSIEIKEGARDLRKIKSKNGII